MADEFVVESLNDTAFAASKIAQLLSFPACIYLNGEMGSGKTTFTKYLLRNLGYEGPVTSPTYNLIQEYKVEKGMIYHMDLYRLEDATEMEFLGLDDLWSSNTLFLIEWPQNGAAYLQEATGHIDLDIFFDQGLKKRKLVVDL